MYPNYIVNNNNNQVFYDIGFSPLEPWWESKKPPKPIVAQRTLYDIRDNNSYTVRKLADGNCWMTQNLRLVGSKTLTPSDSNVSASFTLTASDSGTWCTTNDAACDDKSMVLYSGNTTYGTYYNWYAATAGTGTYSMTSGDATSSICPKGWHLPSGKSSGEFQVLYNNYPSNTIMIGTPSIFTLPGYKKGEIIGSPAESGLYWSSTAYDSSNAYRLGININGGAPSTLLYGREKYHGMSVRCVAQ